MASAAITADNQRRSGDDSGRAAELLRAHQRTIFERTDRMFAYLMLLQWAAGILAAVTISPRTWDGVVSRPHLHVYMAIYLGGAIAALPVVLAWVMPGTALTRQVIAVAQMVFSSLLIHLTGGRIETHFHVFGSLAFLAAYRDSRVLVTASLIVALDHALRGLYWPQSVYGVLSANGWRWLEHVGWVLFEDVFLWIAIRHSHAEMRAIADRQAEAEEAREQVEAASHAKSAFLAHMSHEIRTPMTAILGYAGLMGEAGEQQTEQERADCIETIRRNGEHLLTILNDILDMSKIEAGKLNVEEIECAPARVVEEVMAVMRPRAVDKGLRVAVEYRTAVPLAMRTDPTRVRQILINLVSNAIKFTEQGEVRVAIDVQGNRMRFEVRDTGIGLTDDQVQRLFVPFSQGDDSTNRRFGGTGLGLSISKRLAELLGGRIEVASEKGRGSTFTLSLPVQVGDGVRMVRPELEEAVERIERVVVASSVTRQVVAAGERGRVLLVDDAPDTRKLLTRLLELNGLAVDTAEDGRIAVEKAMADGRGFDVILMDMQMPDMDGYAATGVLRERGYAGSVVALTAHASEQDREKCLAAGCDEYLAKPFDLEDLVALVRRLLVREPAESRG